MAPIPRLFVPVTIGAANDDLRFTVTGGGSAGVYSGTVAQATYYDPETLLAAVQTGILAATLSGAAFSTKAGAACTVAMSTSGQVSITLACDGATAFAINWTTSASHQALGTLLGFATAADDTDSSAPFVFAADYLVPGHWTPERAVKIDTGTRHTWTRRVVETAGGQSVAVQHGIARHRRTLEFELLAPAKVFAADATGANTNGSFEDFYATVGSIMRWRYWPDLSDTATYSDLAMCDESGGAVVSDAERYSPGCALYTIRFTASEYTA